MGKQTMEEKSVLSVLMVKKKKVYLTVQGNSGLKMLVGIKSL